MTARSTSAAPGAIPESDVLRRRDVEQALQQHQLLPVQGREKLTGHSQAAAPQTAHARAITIHGLIQQMTCQSKIAAQNAQEQRSAQTARPNLSVTTAGTTACARIHLFAITLMPINNTVRLPEQWVLIAVHAITAHTRATIQTGAG